MESKFSPTSVGIFILLSSAAIVGFTVWFFSNTIFINYKEYKIIFPSSIAGLYSGSIVTYNGVQVGTVSEVNIEEKFGNKVVAYLSIKDNIKVKENTVASLNMKGITGQMFIELHGGSLKSPLLKPDKNNHLIIKYQESTLNMLTNAAPVILSQISKLIEKLEQLISGSNKKNLEEFMTNLNRFAKQANNLPASLDKTLTQINQALHEAKDMMQEASKSLASIPTFLNDSRQRVETKAKPLLTPIIKDVQTITDNISQFTLKVNNHGLLGILSGSSEL